MGSASDRPASEGQRDVSEGILRRFGQVAFVFVLQALILFLAAGRCAVGGGARLLLADQRSIL